MDTERRYIGVFDSGVGGLTAVRILQHYAAGYPIVYFGDTARVPYGTKSNTTILRYVQEGVQYLQSQYPLNALLLACNTASSVAAPLLRKTLSLPVVDVIEPAAKAALEATRSGQILILGTYATIENRSYERSLAALDTAIVTFGLPCPLFVALAEEGLHQHPIAYEVAQMYLAKFRGTEIDTVILGCTHFPLLIDAIAAALPNVTIINSGAVAAAQLAEQLFSSSLPSQDSLRTNDLEVVLTDMPRQFPSIAERFLGRKITSLKVIPEMVVEHSDVMG